MKFEGCRHGHRDQWAKGGFWWHPKILSLCHVLRCLFLLLRALGELKGRWGESGVLSFPRKNVLLPEKLQRWWSCISRVHVKELLHTKLLLTFPMVKTFLPSSPCALSSISGASYCWRLCWADCLAWNQKKKPEYFSAIQILVKIGLILAKGCKGFKKNTYKCTWKFLHAQWDFVSSTSTWNSWKRVTVRIIPRFWGIRVRTVCDFQERQSCLLRGDFDLPLLKGWRYLREV